MPLISELRRQRQVDLCEFKTDLWSEFQDSQSYTEKPCLKTKENETKQNKTKLKQTNYCPSIDPLCILKFWPFRMSLLSHDSFHSILLLNLNDLLLSDCSKLKTFAFANHSN